MKRFIAFIFILLISTAAYSATYEASNNDAMPTVLYGKTSSGAIAPIAVDSSGSISGVGSFTSDSIGSDAGEIRLLGRDNLYNNAFDINFESYKTILMSPVGEVTDLKWAGNLLATRLLVGGVKRISGTDVLSKAVAYYHLDETSGTVVTDSVGTNHGAFITGDVSTQSGLGLIGGAMRFREEDNKNLSFGSGTIKVGSGDFTVCLMVRTNTTNEATSQVIAGSRSDTGTNVGWMIQMVSGGSLDSGYANQARFAIDIGASVYQSDSASVFDDGSYHQICGRRSGATIALFFDGVQEGTPTGSSSSDIATLAGNTYLGGQPLSPGQFSGDIDEFMVFNDDLSDAEILALCNKVGGVCQGTGTLTLDSSTSSPNIFSTTESETSVHGLTDSDDVIVGDKLEVQGQMWVNSPTAQTIAAGDIIAADACGSNKWVTSAGAVTTDTTNSFTAPTEILHDCCMKVVNIGSNNITVDKNANNFLAGAADVVLGAGDSISVCEYWNGSSGAWYQIGSTGNN